MNAKDVVNAIAVGSVLNYKQIAEAQAIPAEEIKTAVIDRIKRVYALVLGEERERRMVKANG